MLEGEVKEIVRDLGLSADASEISISADREGPKGALTRPLGEGRFLHLVVGESPPEDVDEALERAVRALRAAARRWDSKQVPLTAWPEASETPTRSQIAARIVAYLEALAASSRARNALVTLHSEIVSSASTPLLLESERVPFILKRVAADAQSRDGTSFGEIEGDDFYARSFWVGADLIMFFEGPWARDFVRHRARHVCRELGHLLGDLEPEPSAPASIAPVPPKSS